VRSPAILAPLRHRDFRLLLVGQTVSIFGNNFFLIALPFQLIALGATPLQLGIAVTLAGVSTLVFLLLGGAIADRASRRRIILTADAVGALVTSAVATLALTSQLRIEHLYVAALILGGTSAFRIPAYTAIITELVPADLLTAANAARTLGGALGRTAGRSVRASSSRTSAPRRPSVSTRSRSFSASSHSSLPMRPRDRRPAGPRS
jgi:MFS family permease